MSLNAEQMELLKQLQATGFALIDLHLHLDAHPSDTAAAERFKTLSQRHRILKRSYEERVGPLNPNGESRLVDPKRWTDTPWPWEL